jgi:uncharacterized protein with HEPN domain
MKDDTVFLWDTATKDIPEIKDEISIIISNLNEAIRYEMGL